MRILLINPFFWPYGGGIEYHIEGLVKNLGKKHDVTVMTSNVEEVYEEEKYDVIRVPCFSANLPLLSPPPFVFTPAILPSLVRAAGEFDLVHLHTRWYPDYVLASVLAKKLSGKPLFFTAHEPAELNIDPLLNVFAKANDLTSGKLLLGNSHLFSVSRAVASTFNRVFHKETLRVVYNGVDTKEFNPHVSGSLFKESVGLTSPYILYVGRLIKQKTVQNLLRAFAGVESELELAIIGRGNETGFLKSEAKRLGVEGRVKFVTEFLDKETLVSAYAGCEFFVLPSRWEAFGIVLAEAMACGKCCVGTDAGGIPEVIGDAGIVVPKGDIEAMRDAIDKLEGDRSLRKKLGKKGRKRVLSKFTWEKTAERTLEGYEEILEGRN